MLQTTVNRTVDELGGHCFGCGPSNPQGLHLHFTNSFAQDTGLPQATANVTLSRMYEGAPGCVHGGIIATLLDEAMSKLNRSVDALAMTRRIEVDYLRPVPVGQNLILTANHVSRPSRSDGTPGRKLIHQSELQLPDGTVLARAHGIFIIVNPNLIQQRLAMHPIANVHAAPAEPFPSHASPVRAQREDCHHPSATSSQ